MKKNKKIKIIRKNLKKSTVISKSLLKILKIKISSRWILSKNLPKISLNNYLKVRIKCNKF